MGQAPFNEVEMMFLAELSYFEVPGNNMNPGGQKMNVSLNELQYYDDSTGKTQTPREYFEKRYGVNNPALEGFLAKVEGENYSVSYAENDKHGTGFAAIAVEGPSEGTVTVAARGTEGFRMDYDSRKDVYTDAQLGFLEETNQQARMDAFMENMDSYDSIYVTGHSLGGNLAVSGALRYKDKSKIEHVYTYNAPGQNDKYRKENAEAIYQLEDRITNYQNEADIVSDINEPIGNVRYVKTKGSDKFFNNHLLFTMDFDENGFNYTNGKRVEHETLHELIEILIPSLPYVLPSLLTQATMLHTVITIVGVITVLYVVNIVQDAIVAAIEKLKNFLSANFSMGGWYASNNPYILVNTYKLEDYANRISRINNRVDKLDRQLDSLYWKVCDIEDLLSTASALRSLINADILLGYNSRLKKCVQYLNETAEEFRTAERNINNKMLKP